MEYRVGQLVRSKAGRDKGIDFVVVKSDNGYVYVADGRMRKLENPKKKKIKHIQGSYKVSDSLAELIESGSAENYMIREFLTHHNS